MISHFLSTNLTLPQLGQSSVPVDGHRRVPDRDRNSLHVVQGRVQPQVEPAEPGDHQMLEPLHRNRRVQLAG